MDSLGEKNSQRYSVREEVLQLQRELKVWVNGWLRTGVGQTTGYGPNLPFVMAHKLKMVFTSFNGWGEKKVKRRVTFVICEN